MSLDFTYVTDPDPHKQRRREILARHPEVKDLQGRSPVTALCVVVLVAAQWTIAWALSGQSWIWLVVTAYLFGAFVNHALYALVHELTHKLAFRKTWTNNLFAILCDLAIAFPTSMPFRKYHLLHHQRLGDPEFDPDLAPPAEAKLIGNSTWRKALWMLLFGVSQGMRPTKIKRIQFMDRWILLGQVVIVASDVFVFLVLGPKALLYLVLSTVFGVGLHPVGGRWIQEHFVTAEGQETYSYYGALNRVCFNVGHHNEHHDLPQVPWYNLPKLRKAAPEFYDGLKSYRSWTALLLKFVFDPGMSAYSRIVRLPEREREPVPEPSGGA